MQQQSGRTRPVQNSKDKNLSEQKISASIKKEEKGSAFILPPEITEKQMKQATRDSDP